MESRRRTDPRRALGMLLLILLSTGGCGADDRAASRRIPDGTVVLTFDDAICNHPTFVAPLLEDRGFDAHGIPLPRSFGWPTCGFGPEARGYLKKEGYRFARRGQGPESAFADGRPGPAHDPSRHDPLLTPSAELRSDGTLERLQETVNQARRGRAVVVMFHGIPDPGNPDVSVTPELFTRFLNYLVAGGFHVVSMRRLAE